MKKIFNFSSFGYLNCTQFLGALNDNLFKTLIIFLLIGIQGTEFANAILGKVGGLFVAPFLLFSQTAGILADKVSKKKITVGIKWLEVVIALFGVLVFYFQIAWAAYLMLFLMATQSALFGPAKYGIVKELVAEDRITKANGSLNAFTYLAIIIGTALASFVADITNEHLAIASLLCVIVAVVGLLTSYKIQTTPKAGTEKKLHTFPLKELYVTLKEASTRPFLITSILCSSFFLFIGAFAQLNIIPFAIQSLGLDKTKGPYLFAITAIGISIGSLIAGRLSKRGKFTMSYFGAVGIAICSVLLSIFATHLIFVIVMLALLGMFGGIFVVPMDTFIQTESPENMRGQVIASNSFLSFVGVLIASVFLFILEPFGSYAAALGFFITGILTFLVSFVVLRADIEDLIYFYARFKNFFSKRQIEQHLFDRPKILLLPNYSKQAFWEAVLIFKDVHPVLTFENFGFRGFLLRVIGLRIAKQSKINMNVYFKRLVKKQTSLLFFEDQWDPQFLKEIISELDVPQEDILHLQTENGTLQL